MDKAKLIITAIFSFIYSIILFKIIIPLFISNHLLQWDMAGHYFNSWFIKSYIFPSITGWNPSFFGGQPFGLLYPGLFHYIVAIFSFVFSIEFSLKLVLSLVMLITPFSFYYFLRSININKLNSSIITLWMFFFLFLPSKIFEMFNYPGNDLTSTFYVGLVTNALALPLLFFYMGSLVKNYKTKNIIYPSIFMFLIVLSHLVVTLVAAIFSFSFFLSKFILYFKERNLLKKLIRYFIKHILLVFTLSSFWIIPFLFYSRFIESIYLGAVLQFKVYIFFVGVLLSFVILFNLKKI